MSDETPTSRVQFGTRGQRSVRTDETVVILAGLQGPAGRDAQQATWRGAWEPTTQYSTDDIVGWMGDAWISLQDGNLGQQPDLAPAYWDPLTQAAAAQTVENGFEDKWDADYKARDFTDLFFSPETYDDIAKVWIPARLTLGLNTPGAPNADPVTIYAEGEKLEISASIQRFIELPHLAPTGLYLFYYDSTGFLKYQLVGAITVEDLIERYAFTAAVYYVGATETIPDVDWTDGDAVVIGDERHGRTMDSRTHRYLHSTRGSAYESGMGPLNVVVDGSGSILTNNQIGMEDGVFWDEDLILNVTGSSKPYTCPIIYRDGASGDWVVDRNLADSLMWKRAAGPGRAVYNEDLGGGAWQLTEVANNDFSLMHLLAFNGAPYDGASGQSVNKYYLVMGQDTYPTIGAARDGAESEIAALQTGGLEPLLLEFITVATFIVEAQNSSAYGGRLRSTDSGDPFVDWRVPGGRSVGIGLPAHSTTHENGGSDELDVTGLSGLLADAQTPLAHAASHNAPGGADQLADYATAGIPGFDGEKGMVPKPFGHDARSQILTAKNGWQLPDSPTLDIPILTRSDFIPTSLTVGTYSLLTGINSIVDTPGSPQTTLQLVNDAASPGANQVYGTDGGGVKGWKADPGGGGSTFPVTSADIELVRIAAHIAAFRSGLNPTELQLYNSDDGIGNYERGILRWYLGTDLWIGTDIPGGTGLPRKLVLVYSGSPRLDVDNTQLLAYVPIQANQGVQNLTGIDLDLEGQVGVMFRTNAQDVLRIDAAGNLIPQAAVTGTADLGTIGLRFRDIYAARTFISQVATGTAPLQVASQTLVTNLNADQLDSQDGAYYATFEKSGVFLDPAGARDVPVFRAPFNCTVTAVRAIRVGGTAATINARRNGTSEHISSDLAVGTTWTSAGAVQNTAYVAGDSLELRLKSITGSPTEVTVQVEFVKA